MKKPVIRVAVVAIVIALVALAFYLFRSFSSYGKVQLATTTLILDMGLSYENFLADGGDAHAFHSPEELISQLEGNNPRGIRYLCLAQDSRNERGQVIDDLGRPLRIQRMEGKKIEIRAAGKDGKLGTEDDFGDVYPREKGKKSPLHLPASPSAPW